MGVHHESSSTPCAEYFAKRTSKGSLRICQEKLLCSNNIWHGKSLARDHEIDRVLPIGIVITEMNELLSYCKGLLDEVTVSYR